MGIEVEAWRSQWIVEVAVEEVVVALLQLSVENRSDLRRGGT